MQAIQLSQGLLENSECSKLNVFDDIDFRIKDVVDEEPFLSVRQIATLTGIPKSTVFERLTEKLGYISKHLKWVPHLLSEEKNIIE